MVKTGVSDFDAIFNYGNYLSLIYGKASTGKTTCCLLTSIAQAKENNKVIFLDVEGSFSLDRFRQLSNENYFSLLDNILLFKVKNFEDQLKCVENLKSIVASGKISLIIIDTIGIYYRQELKNDPYIANKDMDKQLKTLNFISREYKMPIILTNQVYADIKDNKINVVGGDMVKNWCKLIVELELNDNKRKLCLLKPEKKELFFDIKEGGIFKI